jgi:uncharacterized membrane protein YqjE
MSTHDPTNGGARAVEPDPRDKGLGGKIAGKGAGMLAGAAVVALLGLGALTAFLIIVLDSFLPLWAAALIVTVLWLAIAAVLGLAGKNAIQKATPPAPQTVETVKEDIQWAKTQTGSAAR